MKVGICGCYDNHNYGSMLQAYANEYAVRSLGHDCEFIRYKKHYTPIQMIRQAPRLFNGGRIVSLKKARKNKELAKQYPEIQSARDVRSAAFDRFCREKFTHLSDEFVGYEALCKASDCYDIVQVGSDQLWLPAGLPTNFYNLQFAKPGVRRVSYATSFGVSSIPWYQRRRTADYLKKIDFLSVREQSGANIVKDVAGLDASVVVDPTLLLSADEWLEAMPKVRPYEKPYIFCYFLGANPLCRQEARTLSEKTGLPIVVLRHLDDIIPSDEEFGDIAPYDVDPAGFVNLIRSAEYVLTDSFHGSVFSTLYHKNFVTFYRFLEGSKQSRNSRIDNLLGHLDLEERLVKEPGRTDLVLTTAVDFDCVDDKLATWREGSWSFLREALA